MKFKVGDKVRVKTKLEPGHYYMEIGFLEIMNKFKGRIVTIKKAIYQSKDIIYYKIEEDVNGFSWSEEMLEPVETFKVGDVVYTNTGKKVELIEKAWLVKFEDGGLFFRKETRLTHTKPLKEITEKELAEMGYVLKK